MPPLAPVVQIQADIGWKLSELIPALPSPRGDEGEGEGKGKEETKKEEKQEEEEEEQDDDEEEEESAAWPLSPDSCACARAAADTW